ncbi:MAG: EamA family transporter [Halobacteriaceae archaeon]
MVDSVVVALSLVPAVLWGFSPVLSKRGMAGGGSSLQAALVVVVVDSVLYWTALFVRQGVDVFAALGWEAIAVFSAAGVFGTAIGRLATFAGVHRVGASVNSAGISTRPLFATLLAAGWLGETVTWQTGVGIVVLVVGLIVLTISKGGDLAGWEPHEILFPIGAAAAFGLGNVLRRFALSTYPDVTLLEAVALNETAAFIVLGAYAFVATRGDVFEAPSRTYAYFAASGTITAVALLSLYAALQRGTVVIVDPISATAPLFTTVFAGVFLADLERVTRGVVVGAVLVVVGVVVITLV